MMGRPDPDAPPSHPICFPTPVGRAHLRSARLPLPSSVPWFVVAVRGRLWRPTCAAPLLRSPSRIGPSRGCRPISTPTKSTSRDAPHRGGDLHVVEAAADARVVEFGGAEEDRKGPCCVGAGEGRRDAVTELLAGHAPVGRRQARLPERQVRRDSCAHARGARTHGVFEDSRRRALIGAQGSRVTAYVARKTTRATPPGTSRRQACGARYSSWEGGCVSGVGVGGCVGVWAECARRARSEAEQEASRRAQASDEGMCHALLPDSFLLPHGFEHKSRRCKACSTRA